MSDETHTTDESDDDLGFLLGVMDVMTKRDRDKLGMALGMKVLAGLAEDRGVERIADLGNLPPLDVFTARRFLTPDEMTIFLTLRAESDRKEGARL